MKYYTLDDNDELFSNSQDQPVIIAETPEEALEDALYQIKRLQEDLAAVRKDRAAALEEVHNARLVFKTERTNNAHLRRLLEFINDPTKLRALLMKQTNSGLDSSGNPFTYPVNVGEQLDQFIAAVRHMRDGEPDMTVEKRWGIKL